MFVGGVPVFQSVVATVTSEGLKTVKKIQECQIRTRCYYSLFSVTSAQKKKNGHIR